jgi:hypothetical protein
MDYSLDSFMDGFNYRINEQGFPCFQTSKQTWADIVLDGLALHEFYQDQVSAPKPIHYFGVVDKHRNGKAKRYWNRENWNGYQPRRSRYADEEIGIEEDLIYDDEDLIRVLYPFSGYNEDYNSLYNEDWDSYDPYDIIAEADSVWYTPLDLTDAEIENLADEMTTWENVVRFLELHEFQF